MNDGLLLRLTNDLHRLIQTQQELVEATLAASDNTVSNLVSVGIFFSGIAINYAFMYYKQRGEEKRKKEKALMELTALWKDAESRGRVVLDDCLDALRAFGSIQNPKRTELDRYIGCLDEVEREWLPELESKCHALVFQLGIDDHYLTLSNAYKDRLWEASTAIREFQQALSISAGKGCSKPDVKHFERSIGRAHRKLMYHLQSLSSTPIDSSLMERITRRLFPQN